MAKTKISEFSATPANNTDIDNINIAEGCAPSGINDAIRELMAQLKDFQVGSAGDSFNGPVGTTTAAAGAFTTLSATGVTTVQAGTNSAPAITTSGDTNTGIFFPAADTIAFAQGGAEAMRIDSSGNVGIGTTSTPVRLSLVNSATLGWPESATETIPAIFRQTLSAATVVANGYKYSATSNGFASGYSSSFAKSAISVGNGSVRFYTDTAATVAVGTDVTPTERARITSAGDVLIGTTASGPGNGNTTVGIELAADGQMFVSSAAAPVFFNRNVDGTVVSFSSAGTAEGTISISGTTTSYNGGHLSRWAQTTTAKDESLVKGTVMSNLDEMNVYVDAAGNPVANEQLNKVKVSDVEGDANVAGVFVNWTHDDAHNVDEINMAMTGDMIIRIAQGVTVQRGDLLMSAGDGTAKPQGDDIVRSKTIAKVTSTHVTCTYADGSFCVPCVLMAC